MESMSNRNGAKAKKKSQRPITQSNVKPGSASHIGKYDSENKPFSGKELNDKAFFNN